METVVGVRGSIKTMSCDPRDVVQVVSEELIDIFETAVFVIRDMRRIASLNILHQEILLDGVTLIRICLDLRFVLLLLLFHEMWKLVHV